MDTSEKNLFSHPHISSAERWYSACAETAEIINDRIPEYYRSRTFSGIIGDIKALSSKKALSLISRKKGLGMQYSQLYLIKGIDWGRGYQACASEALLKVIPGYISEISNGRILDAGCAVGVSAGVLGLGNVIGFDLFPDLLGTAKIIDSITGIHHDYLCADMTRTWPFTKTFDTVICSLVCHHLKEQKAVVSFFNETNRVLKEDGNVLITLPSGSVTNFSQLNDISHALRCFGFEINPYMTGIVISTDDIHSVFWMFLIVARKIENISGQVFIDGDFGFNRFKTPELRVQKGEKARKTVSASREIRHSGFKLIDMETHIKELEQMNFQFPQILSLI